MTTRNRAYYDKLRADGYHRMDLWLSPNDVAAIRKVSEPRGMQSFIRAAIREKAASMGVIVPVIVKDGAL